MNFSAWSIRNPVPPIAIFMALIAVGIVGFFQLPVTNFPNIDIPIVTVSVSQPGSAPAEIMNQVGQPIENSITSVSGVKHITTVATDSTLSATVEFDLEADSQRALNDVKDAVTRVRADLPGSVQEPIVQRLDITGLPIVTYSVTDPSRSIEELSHFIDDDVERELQGLDSIGDIRRVGGVDEEINVELDPARLASLGITAAEVSQQVAATNINLGGGRGDLGSREFSIRALGSSASVADLASLPITLSGDRSVRLDQLGTVRDGGAEIRSYANFNGEPIVAFQILRSSGGSDTEAADSAYAAVDELRTLYPDVEFTKIDDVSVYTRGNYEQTMTTLYEGAALAVVVVFLFLRNWRSTLIAGVALPLSVIPTFFVMWMLDFSLNGISLLAVTLVTGILVDDAIVEIENIERHIAMGKSPYKASLEAADEIGLTVVAISSTIVAVFAPVSFMSGIAGQYFRQFGLTVAIAVLFSLLVARLITPMMTAFLLKDTGHREVPDGLIMRNYLRVLGWTMRQRALTLIAGLVFFAVSIYSATLLPTGFLPAEDNGRSVLSVELPPGSQVADNLAVTRAISERLFAMPEVENVLVTGGNGPSGGAVADPTQAVLSLYYVAKDQRTLGKYELEAKIEAAIADIPDIRAYFAGDGGQRAIVISVLGEDQAKVDAYARDLVDAVNGLGMVKNVTSGASLMRPEIQITPKPDVAAELGVTANAIAETIRVATIGDIESRLPKFNRGDRQVPILVRLDAEARRDLSTLRNQMVPTASGGSVPLGVVAEIKLADGPTQLERYDRAARVTIGADLPSGMPLGPALEAIYALPLAATPPDGVRLQSSGDAEVMEDVFSSFGLALGAGILMVYAVLVLLFGGFLTPTTILLSLPLSVGGAILALYFADRPISLPVVIGFLMLMGIVTKNAIMLVEFAVMQERAGVPRREATLDAAHKRARPIVMTTIAMIAGMVPSALGVGEGGEFRSPMAIAVIGGLVVSTLLSLVFIPSLHSFMEGLGDRLKRWSGLLVNKPSAADRGEADKGEAAKPQPAE